MSRFSSTGHLLKQINDAAERNANNSLRERDLTLVQVWVLLALDEEEDQTAPLKNLERGLGVAQSTCAGIVKRLAQKGLVDCFTDAADKRVKLVQLTDAGRQCCRETSAEMDAFDAKMFRGFSEADKAQLQMLLERVYKNTQ